MSKIVFDLPPSITKPTHSIIFINTFAANDSECGYHNFRLCIKTCFWSHFLDPPEADNDHFHNPENLRWITKSIISFDDKKKCIIKNFLQMRIIWSVKNAFLTVFFSIISTYSQFPRRWSNDVLSNHDRSLTRKQNIKILAGPLEPSFSAFKGRWIVFLGKSQGSI